MLAYNFDTGRATYIVSFDPDSYNARVHDYPVLLDSYFAIGIFQFPHELGDRIPLDNRIPLTIEAIISDFLAGQKQHASILLYHCDFEDGKQRQRSIRFRQWYQKSALRHAIDMHEVTIEQMIPDKEPVSHYMGYLASNDNPLIDKIEVEFGAFAANLASTGKSPEV